MTLPALGCAGAKPSERLSFPSAPNGESFGILAQPAPSLQRSRFTTPVTIHEIQPKS